MTWRERMRSKIVFISPEQEEYRAFWIKNSTSFTKKIGKFDYPYVPGTRVQDLDITSASHPIPIYFEGDNNDIDAQSFARAFRRPGAWEVIHPVLGFLRLQPLAVTIHWDPVESGNITVVDTDWMEYIEESQDNSSIELALQMSSQSRVANENTAIELKAIDLDDAMNRSSFVSSVISILQTVQTTIALIASPIAEVNNAINAIYRGVQESLDNTVLPILEIASAIQEMITLPARISGDFKSRYISYLKCAKEILGSTSDGFYECNICVAQVEEVALNALLIATAQMATMSTYDTRKQVIQALDDLGTLYQIIIKGLDARKVRFADLASIAQYYPQSHTFTDILCIIGIARAYLLRASYSLIAEKRLILNRERTPLEICITEYGSEDKFDMFIATNNLKGNDILLLGPGREVVIYD